MFGAIGRYRKRLTTRAKGWLWTVAAKKSAKKGAVWVGGMLTGVIATYHLGWMEVDVVDTLIHITIDVEGALVMAGGLILGEGAGIAQNKVKYAKKLEEKE
jgi:hypothetical protein